MRTPRMVKTMFLRVKPRILAVMVCSLAPMPLPAAQEPAADEVGETDPAPDAAAIMEQARSMQRAQNRVLTGRFLTGGRKVPLSMELAGGTIRYRFTDPDQTITVSLGEDAAEIEQTLDGIRQTRPITLDAPVRGTDVTFEELSLRFLYWKDAAVIGSELFRSRSCWKLELKPDGAVSQYSRIVVWIDKGSGALVKAECFDAANDPRTRFSVIGARRLDDGTWTLSEMRIERMQGGRVKDATPTRLLLDEPKAAPAP